MNLTESWQVSSDEGSAQRTIDITNFIFICVIIKESGEVYRKVDVRMLEVCTGEYE
jgi:hypothetical protein